jgi:hypothetical protein
MLLGCLPIIPAYFAAAASSYSLRDYPTSQPGWTCGLHSYITQRAHACSVSVVISELRDGQVGSKAAAIYVYIAGGYMAEVEKSNDLYPQRLLLPVRCHECHFIYPSTYVGRYVKKDLVWEPHRPVLLPIPKLWVFLFYQTVGSMVSEAHTSCLVT